MLIITIFVVIMGVLSLLLHDNLISNRQYIIFGCLLLSLIAAFRSIYFGSDTLGYLDKYAVLSQVGLRDLVGLSVVSDKDQFFYIFAKTLSLFGVSDRGWLAIIAVSYTHLTLPTNREV